MQMRRLSTKWAWSRSNNVLALTSGRRVLSYFASHAYWVLCLLDPCYSDLLKNQNLGLNI